MTQPSQQIAVYLEVGKKRTIAGAIAWPGWCRFGRDEESALADFLAHGPRYARILREAGLDFEPPSARAELTVVERLEGNATTDFGAPDIAPSSDSQALDSADLQRLQTLLRGCWLVFAATVQSAVGRELRKGPRGGGRELEGIVDHVLAAHRSYLARLAWKYTRSESLPLEEQISEVSQATVDALAAASRGELPTQGPRGGAIWLPRYFVRRAAYHIVDHIWEIEDRLL